MGSPPGLLLLCHLKVVESTKTPDRLLETPHGVYRDVWLSVKLSGRGGIVIQIHRDD